MEMMNNKDVISYISKLGDTLTQKEYNFLMTVYYIVRDNYSIEQHFDVIQSCCETILSLRDSGLSNRDLFQNILKNVYTNVSKETKEGIRLDNISVTYDFGNEECFDATAELRGLLALFDMDSMDKVKDEIFLRVLKGEDKKKLAFVYHVTEKNIEDFYNEKLAVVNGIRVKDGKVFVDELENYSKRLEDKLRIIQANVLGMNYIKSNEDYRAK